MTKPLRTLLVVAPLLFAWLGWSQVARADAIAVFGVEAVDAPEAAANQLTEALREKARQTPGVRMVANKDFTEVKMLYGCMDPATVAACVAPAGKSVGADKMLIGTITGTKKGKKLHVSLKLVDVKTGTVLKFIDEEVGPFDLVSGAQRWFAALVPPAQVAPPPANDGHLIVHTNPPGAMVYVDGKAASTTPLDIVAPPGKHTIELVKDTYEKESREVVVRAGETAQLEVSLRAVKPPEVAKVTPPPEQRKDLITPPPLPPAKTEHPGRAAMVVGGVLLAAALIDGGIAIYTFKHYNDLQDTAHAQLDTIRSNAFAYGAYVDDTGKSTTGEAWVSMNNSNFFLAKPNCDVPAHGPPVKGFNDFVTTCHDGEKYATITTVLDVGLGVLAAAGVTSLAIGIYQSTHANAAEKPKTTLAPRLRLLSPVVTRSGGGLSAAFEF